MLITVKDSKEVWKSPDGQRQIWDITDSEGNTWSTMSKQISQAIGQTMELTTRVSAKGKTYLVKPPQDSQAPQEAPQALDGISAPGGQDQIDRLVELVDRFQAAVERFEMANGRYAGKEDKKTYDDDQTPAEVYEELAGKEIQDDL